MKLSFSSNRSLGPNPCSLLRAALTSLSLLDQQATHHDPSRQELAHLTQQRNSSSSVRTGDASTFQGIRTLSCLLPSPAPAKHGLVPARRGTKLKAATWRSSGFSPLPRWREVVDFDRHPGTDAKDEDTPALWTLPATYKNPSEAAYCFTIILVFLRQCWTWMRCYIAW